MADFAADNSSIFGDYGKAGGEMAKKRERKPTWRSEKSRYFPVPLSGQTIDPVKGMLNQLVADLQVSNSLEMLDSSVNQQVIMNLLIVWARTTLIQCGAKHLEKELGPALRQLGMLVAEDMISRGKELDPAYYPEEFIPPKRRKKTPE